MTPEAAAILDQLDRQAPLPESYDDVQRIVHAPRADYDEVFAQIAMAWADERWRRPGAPMTFRPIQATAMLAAHLTHGALLPIGTGHGKSLLFLLIADALGAKRPLGLIPPSMRVPFERGRKEYALSFKVPPNLRIMAYSQLSVANSTDVLERLAPDVIVADEAHNLRNLDSARTKRLVRYMKAHPETLFVPMSGTLTSKSIADYVHLSEWALKRGSPVPHTKFFPVLQSFCAVLDAKNQKVSGDRYNVPAQAADFARMSPLFPDWQDYDADPVEDEYGRPGPSERVVRAREVFRQHLTTTAGVVATDTASIGASLLFIKREVQAPPVVLEAIDKLEASWCRPDGEELTDAPAIWRCARQLTQGFYYRWVWPEGKVDKDWMFARAAWHREIREVLKENRPHLDSPLLISRSARAALDERESLLADRDTLLNALKEWLPHSAKRWGGQRTPPTEPVWLSEYLLDDAAEWRKENPKGILWYGEGAVATKLAERGERVYGAGTDPEAVRGAHGMACSIAAHKDGKNLQYGHSTNLILTFDPSGTVMEQLISRTHRSGQEEDEVSLAYYAHTASAESAVTSALNNARYIEQTQGVPQRLCYGTWL